MLNKVAVLILLMGIMFTLWCTNLFGVSESVSPTLVLGFLLLAAYCAGSVLEKLKIPKITGYIVAGMFLDSYFLKLAPEKAVNDLYFINSLALAFISFCAGGELKLSHLKHQIRSIVTLIISQTFVVFFGVTLCVFFLIQHIPVFDNVDNVRRLVISLIFGIISIARSPSSTIAIISETKAKGTYTNIVLSVTIVKDVVVIVLFGIVVSISQAMISSTSSFEFQFLMVLLFEIVVALLLGFILGKGIIYLIKTVKLEFPIVIIGVGFLVIKFSHMFSEFLHEAYDISLNFEPLLICMAAGFVVQNFSKYGTTFLYKMDRISLPIYVVFFGITGATINVEILKTAWIFGLILVAVRLVMLLLASIISGVLAKDEPLIYKNYWLGFITQAGVSLGLLTEIVRRFPSIGLPIQSLLVASITINQLIGPVAFKWALNRVGDTKQGAQRIARERGNAEKSQSR